MDRGAIRGGDSWGHIVVDGAPMPLLGGGLMRRLSDYFGFLFVVPKA